MATDKPTDNSRRAFLYGTVLAVVVTVLLFSAMNAPQCPDGYTPEQIKASDCIVGANIGIGLLIVCIPMIWALCVSTVALILKSRGR
ncbi:MAG TPA: hypothetical protein VK978_01375 [Candidatus Saccharimonadales bacterium]|nr:hypothetical protein [Candidatus Saccharimonadales bacterium]